jgi:glycosyltransferase involved in cell wall biosynthesis
MLKLKRLLIVSECEHWRNGIIIGPFHFVTEIEMWATIFPEIILLTRILKKSSIVKDAVQYKARNIRFKNIKSTKSNRLFDRIVSITNVPADVIKIFKEIILCDAIHIRTPCRTSLIALFIIKLFKKPIYAKYAGIWSYTKSDPISYKIQKLLLKELSNNSVVTVYGRESKDPTNIYNSYTSSLNVLEMNKCRKLLKTRKWTDNNMIIWVGRFTEIKNVHLLVHAFNYLKVNTNISNLQLLLIGEGPLKGDMVQLVNQLGLNDCVDFKGKLGWNEIRKELFNSKLFVLPSISEGFPKVIVEAMATGLPCISFKIGILPELLKNKGEIVNNNNAIHLAKVINNLLVDKEKWLKYSKNSAKWAERVTMENIMNEYIKLIQKSWKCKLNTIKSKREPLS